MKPNIETLNFELVTITYKFSPYTGEKVE